MVTANDRLDRIEVTVSGLSDTVSRLDTRMDGLETRMTRLDTRMDGLETRMTGLETRMTSMEATVSGMATMLASIDNRLTALESRTMLLWISVAGCGLRPCSRCWPVCSSSSSGEQSRDGLRACFYLSQSPRRQHGPNKGD